MCEIHTARIFSLFSLHAGNSPIRLFSATLGRFYGGRCFFFFYPTIWAPKAVLQQKKESDSKCWALQSLCAAQTMPTGCLFCAYWLCWTVWRASYPAIMMYSLFFPVSSGGDSVETDAQRVNIYIQTTVSHRNDHFVARKGYKYTYVGLRNTRAHRVDVYNPAPRKFPDPVAHPDPNDPYT